MITIEAVRGFLKVQSPGKVIDENPVSRCSVADSADFCSLLPKRETTHLARQGQANPGEREFSDTQVDAECSLVVNDRINYRNPNANFTFVPHNAPSLTANMAAVLRSLSGRCRSPALLLLVSGRLLSSSAVTKPALHSRFLLYLTKHFYDVEALLTWKSKFKRRGIFKKNVYYGYTEKLYGPNAAAAYFILNLKGGLRFRGHSDWFRADTFNWDFLNHKDCPLEEIDLSYSVINYEGIENFEGQKSLRSLSLKSCPEVDDWFLSRLHVFQDSLEELDISHCPKITTGGLAALRNLKGLKRLDVSSLPGISNPGLTVILLEEMLPKCDVIADGYTFDMPQKEETQR
ncbi:hypothetical protein WMY93_028963 [Mugilogobius chulae]|uniref:Distal membrane-arm assembly complex protein 2 n=1 Tax=Mugilogobius chulae TaxID=88201 RepID=A0AAW0N0U9_9GOBI